VYDLERNQLVERAAAHGDDVNSVCYVDAENGVGSSTPLLASASDDGLIYMWDK
jgi:WD40 repeat protein